MINHLQVEQRRREEEEEEECSHDGGGGGGGGGCRRSVVEWSMLFFFFLIFQLQLQLGMWKSKHLLPVTTTTTRTTTSPALRYPEQSTNDTQKALSKAKNMVFAGLVAILCGLLSLNLGSNTTATRFLIRNNGDEDVTIKILFFFFLIFQLQLQLQLGMWKSNHLLPVTTTTTTTRTTTSPALRYPEQSTNGTQKALSKAKNMVFAGLVAILCGLLSLNLGSNTTATRFLIRSCNFTTVVGSICTLASIALPFILPRLSWISMLLFFIAIVLLPISILYCSLIVHLSY